MLEELKAGLEMAASALSILRQARNALPESPEKDLSTIEINAAERQLALAESQIAQSLGYELCQCTFPPQIMLYNSKKADRFCPLCGTAARGVSVSVF